MPSPHVFVSTVAPTELRHFRSLPSDSHPLCRMSDRKARLYPRKYPCQHCTEPSILHTLSLFSERLVGLFLDVQTWSRQPLHVFPNLNNPSLPTLAFRENRVADVEKNLMSASNPATRPCLNCSKCHPNGDATPRPPTRKDRAWSGQDATRLATGGPKPLSSILLTSFVKRHKG